MASPRTCSKCEIPLPDDYLADTCVGCAAEPDDAAAHEETLFVDSTTRSSDPELPNLEPGSQRYTVLDERGRGGMGRVLIAHDDALDRNVALKELLIRTDGSSGNTPEEDSRARNIAARFVREARITGQLEHPSITPVHELGQRENGKLYYTMKLVKGRSLDEALQLCRSLEDRLRLLPHFVDLCNAIAYAHSRGVIHRDIKPSNVMIGDYGETVVIDWGLAKPVNEPEDDLRSGEERSLPITESGNATPETQAGQLVGTPASMSPRQASGKAADTSCDIYALGVVLYEILTGKLPHSATTVREVVKQILAGRPPAPRTVDAEIDHAIEAICLKAIDVDPEQRYADARDLGEAVQDWKPARKPNALVRALSLAVAAILIVTPMVTFGMQRYYASALASEFDAIHGQGGYTEAEDVRASNISDKDGEILTAEDDVPSPLAFLVNAHTLYVPYWTMEWDAVSKENFALVCGNEDGLSAEHRAQILSDLERYSEFIDHAKRTLDKPVEDSARVQFATGITFRGGITRAETGNLLLVEMLARLLVSEAYLAALDGDWFTVEGNFRVTARLAAHLRNTPFLESLTTAASVVEIATTGLQSVLRSETVPPVTLKVIQHEFATLYNPDVIIETIHAERLAVIEVHRMLEDGMTSEWQKLMAAGNTHGHSPSVRFAGLLVGVPTLDFVWKRHQVEMLRGIRKSIHALSDTYPDATEKLKQLEQTPALQDFGPNIREALVADTRTRVLCDMGRIACEAEKFAALNSHYPDSLEELFEDVPTDAFSDSGFRYSTTDRGYTLYSFGPNGSDGGGDPTSDIVWSISRGA